MGAAPWTWGGPGGGKASRGREGAAPEWSGSTLAGGQGQPHRCGTPTSRAPGDTRFGKEQLLFPREPRWTSFCSHGRPVGVEGPCLLVWLGRAGPWGHRLPLLFLPIEPRPRDPGPTASRPLNANRRAQGGPGLFCLRDPHPLPSEETAASHRGISSPFPEAETARSGAGPGNRGAHGAGGPAGRGAKDRQAVPDPRGLPALPPPSSSLLTTSSCPDSVPPNGGEETFCCGDPLVGSRGSL